MEIDFVAELGFSIVTWIVVPEGDIVLEGDFEVLSGNLDSLELFSRF